MKFLATFTNEEYGMTSLQPLHKRKRKMKFIATTTATGKFAVAFNLYNGKFRVAVWANKADAAADEFGMFGKRAIARRTIEEREDLDFERLARAVMELTSADAFAFGDADDGLPL